ncbi:MAG: glycerophosphodiester phosphodiesterase [Gammaproteobacteria bacterium]|nr:glycerophosphodiester phosphodiesterase [Gammaproteobacteria bacterium]
MKQPSMQFLAGVVVFLAAFNAWSSVLDERNQTLVDGLTPGPLQTQLQACLGDPLEKNVFSISHRGAPLGYAEHTREGYVAAASMGAGYVECDVTFTKDRELVCRHSQCDLHTTTNILNTPLAEKCSSPPDFSSGTPFSDVKCCTSDITLKEFKSLQGRMDAGDKKAKTVEEYLAAVPKHRPEIKAATGTLMTHKESIELFQSLGVKMIPELKAASVDMPFEGDFTQQQYAKALVAEYLEAGVDPGDVVLQSFNLDDVLFWLEESPDFGRQATWLDGRYRDRSFDIDNADTWKPSMAELRAMGVTHLAPPLWMLMTLDKEKNLIASDYAKSAKTEGLNLIAWTLERSGPLGGGGGWYFQTVKPAITKDSDVLRVLDVLTQEIGVNGVFSDWPATSTFYANCVGVN